VNEELLSWKIDALGNEHAELREELHTHYLTKAEMTNLFVTRDERIRQAAERREWPIVFATIAMTLTAIANVLIQVLK
jgi:hypothetical protein